MGVLNNRTVFLIILEALSTELVSSKNFLFGCRRLPCRYFLIWTFFLCLHISGVPSFSYMDTSSTGLLSCIFMTTFNLDYFLKHIIFKYSHNEIRAPTFEFRGAIQSITKLDRGGGCTCCEYTKWHFIVQCKKLHFKNLKSTFKSYPIPFTIYKCVHKWYAKYKDFLICLQLL